MYTTAAPQSAAAPAAVAEPNSIKAFIEKHSNGSNIYVYCAAFIAAAVMLIAFFTPWLTIVYNGASYAISPQTMISGVGDGVWNANSGVITLALYAVAEIACLFFIKNPKVRSIACIAIALLGLFYTANLYTTVQETVNSINNVSADSNATLNFFGRSDLATTATLESGSDISIFGYLGALATNIIMFIGSFRKKAATPAI